MAAPANEWCLVRSGVGIRFDVQLDLFPLHYRRCVFTYRNPYAYLCYSCSCHTADDSNVDPGGGDPPTAPGNGAPAWGRIDTCRDRLSFRHPTGADRSVADSLSACGAAGRGFRKAIVLGRTKRIDTTQLTNGTHRLVLVADDDGQTSEGALAVVYVLWFQVQN